MKTFVLLLVLHSPLLSLAQQNADSAIFARIYSEVLGNGECHANLRSLCKDVGCRVAGSPQADSAIVWGKRIMQQYEFDTVFLMPVEVPHWVRGAREQAWYSIKGERTDITVSALGGSVGTQGVVTAQVVEVKSLTELETLGETVLKGKIVFFNKAMDPLLINTGSAYGGANDIRTRGPAVAARYGAAGCIIRSLTLADDRYPHTGATRYEEGVTKIPAAALSSVDSRILSEQLKDHPGLTFSLKLSCEEFPRVIQYNVIGQITGSEFPEEYIVVGGHLDSWDIGEGAHDDGCGIVQSIEVLHTLKAIGYRPRHSIRCVLFINEEFGNDGGLTYARIAAEKGETHIAAVESDGGGFTPRGFSMQGSDAQYAWLNSLDSLYEPYNVHQFRRGWSGVDISPLKNDRIALFGLLVDNQRYFDYHHSNNDVFEQVNRRELELGAAAMTCLIYLLDQTGIPVE